MPGEPHGQRSLGQRSYGQRSPWSCKESDTAEVMKPSTAHTKFGGIFCVVLSSLKTNFHFYAEFAAAAAKSLQACPTLCDPIGCGLPGSSIPGILQARMLEWTAISFSNAWKWSCSGMSDSLQPHRLWPTRLVHPWGVSRQEYWSGLPLPSLYAV